MEIAKYRTILKDNGLPELIKETSFKYPIESFCNAALIAGMVNNVFQMDVQTEEYLYEICFNSKMKPLAVFEISHGSINASIASPREIFQKALICGAAAIVLLHNHPSGDITPSIEDRKVFDRVKRAGDLMEIAVVDNIIVANGRKYFSFKENGIL